MFLKYILCPNVLNLFNKYLLLSIQEYSTLPSSQKKKKSTKLFPNISLFPGKIYLIQNTLGMHALTISFQKAVQERETNMFYYPAIFTWL